MAGSETRTVTIKLAAGVGNFRFTRLKPVKTEYDKGEIVRIEYCAMNYGNAESTATIEVTDADTGENLANWTVPSMEPGYQFCTNAPNHAYLGAMPDKNWKLQFKLTP